MCLALVPVTQLIEPVVYLSLAQQPPTRCLHHCDATYGSLHFRFVLLFEQPQTKAGARYGPCDQRRSVVRVTFTRELGVTMVDGSSLPTWPDQHAVPAISIARSYTSGCLSQWGNAA
ncbi:hypothetical protein BaRGS_00011414 [Batillaria attramentaria]|uniref:Secreted protein n=1 Tax=Batillaria attramentaria TaxID=370345 RepID=A0ABD0LDB7_9CAEN